MSLAYDDHPILVEMHRQVDTLYDPAYDGKLFETLFLIHSRKNEEPKSKGEININWL